MPSLDEAERPAHPDRQGVEGEVGAKEKPPYVASTALCRRIAFSLSCRLRQLQPKRTTHRAAERREIIGIPRADQSSVLHPFRILPLRTRIDQFGGDRVIGGHLPSVDQFCVDQDLGTVTDGEDRLIRFEEVPHEILCGDGSSKVVGIDYATRQ